MKEYLIRALLGKRRVEGDHWIWTGTINKTSGRGQVTIKGRTYWVARLSAHLFLGLDIDDPKQQANHVRWCIHPLCFNPDHLYVGNQQQNVADAIAAGSHFSPHRGKSHCANGHEYTPSNTRTRKDGSRACKACHKRPFIRWRRQLKMARALLVA